jgi:hypothetical protein
MAQENKIAAIISTADKQTILQQLVTIKQTLAPILSVSLTPEERQALPKMGDKSREFVDKALDYAVKNPDLVPPYLSIQEALKDYQLVSDLKEMARELSTLSQSVNDALMVAGAEAYEAALIFHASVKGASRTNSPGSEAIYEDLVKRFPFGSRKIGKATKDQSA